MGLLKMLHTGAKILHQTDCTVFFSLSVIFEVARVSAKKKFSFQSPTKNLKIEARIAQFYAVIIKNQIVLEMPRFLSPTQNCHLRKLFFEHLTLDVGRHENADKKNLFYFRNKSRSIVWGVFMSFSLNYCTTISTQAPLFCGVLYLYALSKFSAILLL